MSGDQLYSLLPAIHRLRDAAEGEPLRALLAIMEQELDSVSDDIAGLYDNWFIETCDDWLVPYVGDLLGVRGLHQVSAGTYSQRARVANTLGYRRRKGTAAMLEQLAHDVTGWPARAVEFFRLLATTQYLNHVRLANLAWADLRDTNRLELLGGPFETAARTADVRHIDSGRGKYNIPNIGLYLWRIQPYAVRRATAVDTGSGQYTFHPLGGDMALFNLPHTEEAPDHLAEEVNVPAPLRRRPLYDELEARRQALASNRTPAQVYFGAQPPVRIYTGAQEDEVKPEELLVADLAAWTAPPATRTYTDSAGTPHTLPIKAAFDPKLGRLMLAPGTTGPVLVDYVYGFSGDIGGGPYDRQPWVDTVLGGSPVTWRLEVTRDPALTTGATVDTLAAAVQQWNALPAGTGGIITLLDSRSYAENPDPIVLKAGSQLLILGAERPHFKGDLAVRGEAAGGVIPGALALNGLLIEGSVTVQPGELARLDVAHCTIVPGKGGLTVKAQAQEGKANRDLVVALERSICGPVTLPAADEGAAISLHVRDSIIASDTERDDGAPAVTAPMSAADFAAVTIFGTVAVREVEASNCIFTGKVTAALKQTGCVRFSYVTEDSDVPRRYRCVASPKPTFTMERYGHYAYAQLSRNCPEELRTGADDQAEMGAFHYLQQPQREANLRASLDEYLRFGLAAGLFYVT